MWHFSLGPARCICSLISFVTKVSHLHLPWPLCPTCSQPTIHLFPPTLLNFSFKASSSSPTPATFLLIACNTLPSLQPVNSYLSSKGHVGIGITSSGKPSLIHPVIWSPLALNAHAGFHCNTPMLHCHSIYIDPSKEILGCVLNSTGSITWHA